MCSLRCFAFTVWRIVGRGENPVGPGTGRFGVREGVLTVMAEHGRIQNDEIIKKEKKKP